MELERHKHSTRTCCISSFERVESFYKVKKYEKFLIGGVFQIRCNILVGIENKLQINKGK